MGPDEIERVELTANAFDRASTACFTVGIATPLAAYIYDVSGFRGVVSILTMAVGLAGWLLAAGLTFASKAVSKKASTMSADAVFAFVVTPGIVVILALLLFALDERSFRKRKKEAGE